MKWNNEEITNPNHLARTMILNVLIGLEDQVHKEMFGGLDIRSDIAKRILKVNQKFEVSDFEAEVLLKNISFEIAKIIGKCHVAHHGATYKCNLAIPFYQ